MVKAKPTKPAGGPPPLPNRDVFHRINFAYQSASLLQHLVPKSGSDDSIASLRPKKGKPTKIAKGSGTAVAGVVVEVPPEGTSDPPKRTVQWDKLARKATKEMKKMAVHTQVKLDPSVKQAICKNCSTILIPGLTCRVRNRPSKTHTHLTHHTCLTCQTIRSIPNPPLTPSAPLADQPETAALPAAKKRRINKVAFHEREQVVASGTDGAGAQGAGARSKEHALYRGEKALSGWGAVPQQQMEEPSTE